jgi:tRNA-splicing ligase RtcB
MDSSSFVLSGLGSLTAFSSCPHGAGRVCSRTKLRRELSFVDAKSRMDSSGVLVKSRSHKGLVEESPLAYKDSREVVDTAVAAGFGLLVARLSPLLVVIG